eukprot:scaffold566770_cov14-Prasinocladus_malaysianus.AAC.1
MHRGGLVGYWRAVLVHLDYEGRAGPAGGGALLVQLRQRPQGTTDGRNFKGRRHINNSPPIHRELTCPARLTDD